MNWRRNAWALPVPIITAGLHYTLGTAPALFFLAMLVGLTIVDEGDT